MQMVAVQVGAGVTGTVPESRFHSADLFMSENVYCLLWCT